MEFKKDYGSFEERLNLFCKPTDGEIENNIEIVNKTIVPLTEDMKIVCMEKSDKTTTMIIFYNGSKNSNPCWFGWIPSKEQAKQLSNIQEIYEKIDEENKKNKVWGGCNGQQ